MPMVGIETASGDDLGKRRRDSLDDNRKRASLFNGLGVGEQSTGGFLAFALHLETTEHVRSTRGKANMAHNGNAGLHNSANLLSNAHATLELSTRPRGPPS